MAYHMSNDERYAEHSGAIQTNFFYIQFPIPWTALVFCQEVSIRLIALAFANSNFPLNPVTDLRTA